MCRCFRLRRYDITKESYFEWIVTVNVAKASDKPPAEFQTLMMSENTHILANGIESNMCHTKNV